MSNQFQNRLVGVIVIVALGVIFLPDVLDGKKQREEEQFAEIPLRPEIQDSTLPAQNIETVDLGVNNDSKADGSLSADKVSSADSSGDGERSGDGDRSGDASWHIAEEAGQSTKRQEPKLASSSKPVVKPAAKSAAKQKDAWTIQLGSFNNAANVRGLVKRLRDKGFTAYTLPTKPVDGQLTKVFVGPNVSKDKLSRMQGDIEKLTQLKGRVIAYNPVEK